VLHMGDGTVTRYPDSSELARLIRDGIAAHVLTDATVPDPLLSEEDETANDTRSLLDSLESPEVPQWLKDATDRAESARWA
jgi:hypothetical protein